MAGTEDLHDALLALAKRNKAFYYKDATLDGIKYRVFNYRVASWTDFQEPGGLECRGIMFDVTGAPARLVCRPMAKFFNLGENPSTTGLDLTKVDAIEDKADGSLISTFMHKGELRLKSKGSVCSGQVRDATAWLEKHPALHEALASMDRDGWTVNAEWCSMDNRILLEYPEEHLKILNARNRETGSYLDRPGLVAAFGDYVIPQVLTPDPASFVAGVHAMQDDIEGYVARIGDLWFKIKTDKYVSIHHARSMHGDKLIAAVVDGGADDLLAMCHREPKAIARIKDVQRQVSEAQTAIVSTVETYHAKYGLLDRGAYACGAQKLAFNGNPLIGPAMTLYDGKDPDFPAFIKRVLSSKKP
jgi:T4 RnlA family RNA ligase